MAIKKKLVEYAENTLDLFKEYRGKPMYSQIVRAIKNKIIGEAKGILIAAGITPTVGTKLNPL